MRYWKLLDYPGKFSLGMKQGVTIDVNRVFEPFYRMDSRTENGSGLGLYVVKLLADKLGWKVTAEIQNGIFSVVLYIP